MLISVKLLAKYVIIIHSLGSEHEKFGVWSGPKNCLGENISLNQTKKLFLDFLTF